MHKVKMTSDHIIATMTLDTIVAFNSSVNLLFPVCCADIIAIDVM
jgi:hypothetical protein